MFCLVTGVATLVAFVLKETCSLAGQMAQYLAAYLAAQIQALTGIDWGFCSGLDIDFTFDDIVANFDDIVVDFKSPDGALINDRLEYLFLHIHTNSPTFTYDFATQVQHH